MGRLLGCVLFVCTIGFWMLSVLYCNGLRDWQLEWGLLAEWDVLDALVARLVVLFGRAKRDLSSLRVHRAGGCRLAHVCTGVR